MTNTIKMIASDLDGTLLDPQGKLPDGTFDMIRALHDEGIRFVAASGRQWGNMDRLFAPVKELMGFVCENGSINVLGDEIISTAVIDAEVCKEIIKTLQEMDMDILISGYHSCFILPERRVFADDMVYRLKNTITVVDDLMQINEPIVKISGHKHHNIAPYADTLKERFGDRVHAAVSARSWFDFTGGNKAEGLCEMMERFHIQDKDVLAIGDQWNDEGMLAMVGHPYLMSHAMDSLKAKGYPTCDAVLPLLESLFFSKQKGE